MQCSAAAVNVGQRAAYARRHRLQQRLGRAIQRGGLNPGDTRGDGALLRALPEAVPESRSTRPRPHTPFDTAGRQSRI